MTDEQAVKLALEAVQTGNWRVLVAVLTIAIVAAGRKLAPKLHPGFGKFLNSDRGGAVFALLSGVSGALATALVSHAQITWGLVLAGLVTGVTAAGGVNVYSRIKNPPDKMNRRSTDPKNTVVVRAKKKTRSAVRIPLTLLAVFSLLPGCAAGEFMYRYDQATATAAITAMTCKDALSLANDVKLTECRDKLLGGDALSPGVVGAVASQKCLDEWLDTYATLNKVCRALKIEAQAAQASREIVAAAERGDKGVLLWVLRLFKAGVAATEIFAKNGISLGGK